MLTFPVVSETCSEVVGHTHHWGRGSEPNDEVRDTE